MCIGEESWALGEHLARRLPWMSSHTWSEQSKSSQSCLWRSMPSEHLDTGCTFCKFQPFCISAWTTLTAHTPLENMAPAAARGLVGGEAEVTVVVLKTGWADRQAGAWANHHISNHREAERDVFPLKLTGQRDKLHSRGAGDLGSVQFYPVVLINSSLLGFWHKFHNVNCKFHSADTRILITDMTANLGFQKTMMWSWRRRTNQPWRNAQQN